VNIIAYTGLAIRPMPSTMRCSFMSRPLADASVKSSRSRLCLQKNRLCWALKTNIVPRP
jgi:hypothetical protein